MAHILQIDGKYVAGFNCSDSLSILTDNRTKALHFTESDAEVLTRVLGCSSEEFTEYAIYSDKADFYLQLQVTENYMVDLDWCRSDEFATRFPARVFAEEKLQALLALGAVHSDSRVVEL